MKLEIKRMRIEIKKKNIREIVIEGLNLKKLL